MDLTLTINTQPKNTLPKQSLIAKLFTRFVLLSCFGVFVVYGVQRFGGHYANEKAQEKIAQAGLSGLVQYDSLYFNPFSLTPSLENVRVGPANAPWLTFARLSFNSYIIKHPNLDIDFWIQKSEAAELSRDTAALMRAAGIDTLLGKGHLSSEIENDKLTWAFHLDIKDVGKLTLSADITLLDKTTLIRDLRADALASIAMGQPSALLSIYEDDIEIGSLTLQYEELGLVQHRYPISPDNPDDPANDLTNYLNNSLAIANHTLGLAAALGLAQEGSTEATDIDNALKAFLIAPKNLTLSVQPAAPLSLRALRNLAEQGTLYQDGQITLQVNQ